MAGWFFLAAGTLLVALAIAVLPASRPVAWGMGLTGVAALAFGLSAPRRMKVAALDGVVSLVLAI